MAKTRRNFRKISLTLILTLLISMPILLSSPPPGWAQVFETVKDLWVNGNAGMGTTAPGARLDIKGSGTSTGFALRIADSNAADKLVVFDNGNVGIGTTSPSKNLVVAGVALLQDKQIIFEGFEGGGFPPTSWTTGGDANWSRDTVTMHTGSASAASGAIGDSQSTWLDRNYTFDNDGYLRFYWKVDSEDCGADCGDFLVVCVDNDASCSVTTGYFTRIHGDVNWTEVNVPVAAGTHSFRWLYGKDSGAVSGSDKGWVDDITMKEGGMLFSDAWSSAVSPANSLIYHGGAEKTITFSTDNTDRMIITADGNVDIGTKSPNAQLHIYDGTETTNIWIGGDLDFAFDGGGNSLFWFSNTGGDGGATSFTDGNNQIMTIYNSGNVGIGTTNPGAKLEVNGQLKITGGAPGISKVLTSDGSGLATWEFVPGGWSRNAPNVYLTVSSDNVGIGTSTPAARLDIVGSGFDTGPAMILRNSNLTPKVTFLDNGNIGIGVTDPAYQLDVVGDIHASSFFHGDVYPGYAAGGWVEGSSETRTRLTSFNVGVGIVTPDAKLHIVANDTGTGFALHIQDFNSADKVVILDNGSVGIGTTLPNEKLEVDGGIKLGNTTSATDGIIRWTGVDFEGRKGGNWASLTAGGAGGGNPGGSLFQLQYNYPSGTFGGTPLMVSDGNNLSVGIATTGNAARLYIKGAGTGTGITLRIANSTPTDNLVVLDNGNVGIGLTNPAYKLDLQGAGTAPVFRINGYILPGATGANGQVLKTDGSGNVTWQPASSGTPGGSVNQMQYNSPSGTFGGTPLIVSDGSNLSVGTGATNNASRLYVKGAGTTSGFALRIADSQAADRLVVLDNGRVGIGVTNPSDALVHVKSTDGTINLRLQNANTGGGDWYIGTSDNSQSVGGGGKFYLSPSNVTQQAAFVILQNGNMGIGYTSPQYTLHVAGTAAAQTLRFGTNLNNILPAGTGTNGQVLQTNGTGVLSWASVGEGDIDTVGDCTSGDCFTGTQGTTLTFNVGVGETAPTISSAANGNLTVAAPSGTVILGSNTGNIDIALSNPADVLTVTKTSALSATYNNNDFTFTRTFTGGSYTQAGAILKIIDSSTGTGNIKPDMLLINAANTNPSGSLLRLQAANADKVIVANTGNVGIATTNPSYTLQVAGTAAAQTLRFGTNLNNILPAGTGTANQVLQTNGTGTISWATVSGGGGNPGGSVNQIQYNSPSGTFGGTPLIVSDGNNLSVGTGATGNDSRLFVKGAGSGTGMTLRLQAADNYDTFVVLDYGNVGIGTTNPTEMLMVNNSYGTGTIAIRGVSNPEYAYLQLIDGNNNRIWELNHSSQYPNAFSLEYYDFITYGGWVNRMVILPSGNMGLSTTSPVARLDIRGSGTTNNFALRIADSSAADKLVVLDKGYVGIGTTNPAYKLDLQGTGTAPVFRINGYILPGATGSANQILKTDASGNVTWQVDSQGNANPGGSVNQMQYNSPSGTFGGTPLIVSDGSNLSVGTGATGNASRLYIKGAGTTAGFALRIADSNAADTLVVLDNGYTGIGTTNPTQGRLVVVHDNVSDATAWFQGPGGSTWISGQGNALVSGALMSDYVSAYSTNTLFEVTANGTGDMALQTNSTGNVGIGTSVPNAKLSVNGSFKVNIPGVTDGTIFSVDTASGVTSADALQLGSMSFEEDAGIVSWIDLPVATTTSGLVESYTAQIDSNPVMTLYSITDGSGSVMNLRVGISTTSPSYTLHVAGTAAFQTLRFGTNLDNILPAGTGTANQVLVAQGNGTINWGSAGGGSGTPGTPVNSLQYNYPSGTFAGAALMVTDGSNLSVGTGATGNASRLYIKGEGTTAGFALRIADSSAADKLVVLDNGNVGIGTTNPSSILHVTNGGILATGTTGTTPVSGAGTRIMWIPAKAAFRAGSVNSTEWDDANIGDNSIALGYRNSAAGYASFAAGSFNTAGHSSSDAYSIALGDGNDVQGGYSAVGIGDYNTVNGAGAKAFGNNNTATGADSIAIGYYATAASPGANPAFAFGQNVAANGTQSMVIGVGAGSGLTNSTNQSLAVGFNSTVPTVFVGPSSGAGTFGNVGIATTNPSYRLHVAGTAAAQTLRFGTNLDNILPAGTGTANQVLVAQGNGTINWGSAGGGSGIPGTPVNSIQYNYPSGTFAGASLMVTDGSNLSIGTGATGNASRLYIKGAGTGTGFALRIADSTPTDRMVVLDNGNVGIGTTNPSYQLQIESNLNGNTMSFDPTNGGLWIYNTMGPSTLYLQPSEAAIIRVATPNLPLLMRDQSGNDLFTLSTVSGNVGIGRNISTAPSAKLYIQGSGTGTDFALRIADSTPTDRLVVLDNGNVGIGTTNPLNKFHIIGHTIIDTSSSAVNPTLWLYRLGSWDGAIQTAAQSGNSVPGSQQGDLLFITLNKNIIFSADNGASTAQLTVRTNGNIGIGTTAATAKLTVRNIDTAPTDTLYIRTAGTSGKFALRIADSNAADKLVVLDNGNVGIGTTNPITQLQAYRNIDSWIEINATNASNSANALAEVDVVSATSSGWLGTAPANFTGGGSLAHFADRVFLQADSGAGGLDLIAQDASGYMRFYTGGNATANERMRILAGGNVGIATTNPLYKLHVAGTTATQTLRFGTALDNILPAGTGTANQVLVAQGNGTINWGSAGGGSGIPGTPVNSLQYNYPSGTFAGASLMVTDGSNLSIGTGATGNASRLYVKGAGNTTGFAFRVANSNAADKLVVLDNGNVGIGVTAPLGLLHVSTGPYTSLMVTTDGMVGIGTSSPTAGYYLTVIAPSLFKGSNAISLANSTGSTYGFIDGESGFLKLQSVAASSVRFLDNNNASIVTVANNTGNVGIGVGLTSPNAKLDIKGSGTGTGFALRIADSSAADKLVVLDNGNVGIGLTNPSYKLHVAGNAAVGGTAAVQTLRFGTALDNILPAGTGTANQVLVAQGNGVINWGSAGGGSGTPGTPVNSLQYNYPSGTFAGASLMVTDGSNLSIGTGATNNASRLYIKGTGTTAGFALRIADSNAADKLVVLDNGNVGIGTTNPDADLVIQGDPGKYLQVEGAVVGQNNSGIYAVGSPLGLGSDLGVINITTGGFASYLTINDSSTQTVLIHSAGDSYLSGGNVGIGNTVPYGLLAVGTNPNVTALIVKTNNNVGIRTTNPIYALHVAGTAAAQTLRFGTALDNILPAGTGTANQVLVAQGNGTINWGAAGGGDNISVNGTAATDANFVNTSASGTMPSITWNLNAIPTPNQISISSIGAASASEAGVITTGTQTVAGDKTVSGTLRVTGNSGFGSDGVVGIFTLDASRTGTLTSGGEVNLGGYLYADPSSASSTSYRGLQMVAKVKTGNAQNFTSDMYGGWAEAEHDGTGTLAQAIGLYGQAEVKNTGPITDAYGVIGSVHRAGTGNISNAYGVYGQLYTENTGTVSKAYALYASNPLLSSGTVTDNYGVYIENQTSGSSNNYALFSVGGTNYFGGSVGIGASAPSYTLHVAGTAAAQTLRFGTALDNILPAGTGTANQVLVAQGNGIINWGSAGGGSGTPGTPVNSLQYNYPSGTFAGAGLMVTDGSNLSIGTGATNNASRLYIKGAGTTAGFALRIADSNAADKLVVLDSGNVGIGTTAPSEAFHVKGNIGGGWGAIKQKLENTASDGWAEYQISSDVVDMRFGVNGSTAPLSPPHAYLETFSNHDLYLMTNDTRRVIIKSDGNVGIGTTAPATLFDIRGASANNSYLMTIANSTLSGEFINFLNSSGNPVIQLNQGSSGEGFFYVGDNSNAQNVRISGVWTVDSYIQAGNVGIGLSNPSYKLHVAGTAAAQTLRFGTNLDNILPAGTGTANQVLQTNGSGVISWGTVTGGGGTPGGSVNQLQFNYPSGTFGGTPLIVSDGNSLSVGTGATGNNSRLYVKGAGTTTGFALRIADSTPTDRMVVLDNGNVGIATTAPGYKLEVAGSVKLGSGSGNVNIALSNPADVLNVTKTTTLAATYNTTDFTFKRTLTGSTYTQAGAILQVIDQSTGTGNITPDLVIITGTTSANSNLLRLQSSSTDRVVVNNAGNVGIGITNPAYKIDLQTGSTAPAFRINGYILPGATGAANQVLQTNGSGVVSWGTVTGGAGTPGGSVNQLQFNYPSGTFGGTPLIVSDGNNLTVGIGTTNNNSRLYVRGAGTGTGIALRIADSTPTDRMVVLDNGNVGIGLTNPSYKLDLQGAGTAPIFRINGYILPGATGAANQILKTNGSGIVTWQNDTGGGGCSMEGTINGMLFLSAANTGTGSSLIVTDGSNLSIGTGTTGSNARLLVKGAGAGAGMAIRLQDSNGADKYVVLDNGNIGVGTTNPGEKIEISGNVKLTGIIKQGGLGDLAEMMPVAGCVLNAKMKSDPILLKPEPADVVVIDEDGGIRRSFEPFAANVVGIISTSPAQILRDGLKNAVPVVLSGIVPCKVTAENGMIKPGDMLVASSMPGYAMRAGKNPPLGTVIGKALTKLEKDKGTVDVLVMLK